MEDENSRMTEDQLWPNIESKDVLPGSLLDHQLVQRFERKRLLKSFHQLARFQIQAPLKVGHDKQRFGLA